ncbi:MAG: hypothetical protein Tsb0010_08340 [Parvularculaceae bacterium]
MADRLRSHLIGRERLARGAHCNEPSDGAPAKPSSLIFAFDLATEQWVALGGRAQAVLDHRGLRQVEGAYLTIGGVDAAQNVIGDVVVTTLDD